MLADVRIVQFIIASRSLPARGRCKRCPTFRQQRTQLRAHRYRASSQGALHIFDNVFLWRAFCRQEEETLERSTSPVKSSKIRKSSQTPVLFHCPRSYELVRMLFCPKATPEHIFNLYKHEISTNTHAPCCMLHASALWGTATSGTTSQRGHTHVTCNDRLGNEAAERATSIPNPKSNSADAWCWLRLTVHM